MTTFPEGRKRVASWSPITIFYGTDFPNMATHEDQANCGYSLYKGVLVQWDEDHDERVLMLLDAMPPSVREQLLIVQEHEGSVAFVWNYVIPDGYGEDQGVEVAKDSWSIISSRVLRPYDEGYVIPDGCSNEQNVLIGEEIEWDANDLYFQQASARLAVERERRLQEEIVAGQSSDVRGLEDQAELESDLGVEKRENEEN